MARNSPYGGGIVFLGTEKLAHMETVRWHAGTKIVFRFAFLYFLLDTLYVPMQFLPFFPFQQIFSKYNHLWEVIVPWVGRNILHASHDFDAFVSNPQWGSQDTTFIYVQVFCYLIFAVIGTVIWSLLDRRRENYQELHNWLFLYLRLVLAITMINFGTFKMFPAQFPEPSLSRLMERIGNTSPMGLLWAFMGSSKLYTFFAGAVELLGGVLLLVPRLTTLGALITIAAMGNVLMLNLAYDVPVKLGSTNLLLMAAFLVAPDLKRLLDFFVWNRSVSSAPDRPLFRRKSWNRAAIALQIVFGLLFVGFRLYRSEQKSGQEIAHRTSAPLYGIWSVDEMTLDGKPQLLAASDRQAWRHIIVYSISDGVLETLGGTDIQLILHFDSAKHAFSMTRLDNPGWIAEFDYERPQADQLVLNGKVQGQAVGVTVHKEDESKFLLKTRGFRWIQESSFNR